MFFFYFAFPYVLFFHLFSFFLVSTAEEIGQEVHAEDRAFSPIMDDAGYLCQDKCGLQFVCETDAAAECRKHASLQTSGASPEGTSEMLGSQKSVTRNSSTANRMMKFHSSHGQNSFRSIQSFQERASVVKSIPRFLRGPFRIAMRCAIEEIMVGVRSQNVDHEENGWRFFLLLPRMLLHKPARGGGIPKHKLMEPTCSTEANGKHC